MTKKGSLCSSTLWGIYDCKVFNNLLISTTTGARLEPKTLRQLSGETGFIQATALQQDTDEVNIDFECGN